MAGRHNFQDRIENRKKTAKERQEASDKLTLGQKIAKSTPGSKEHAKLTAKSQK